MRGSGGVALLVFFSLVSFVVPAQAGPLGIANWVVKRVPLPSNDVAYDASRDVVLVTVPSTQPSLGNELVELDPETGDIGRHVFVGSEPGPIAITDDGTTAYVGMRGANTIARIDLGTFTVSSTFSTGADSFFGARFVEDLAAAPGRNDVVAASLMKPGFSPRHAGVWVFDDGVLLPDETPDHTGANRIEFADASTLYGYNNETTSFEFWKIGVDAGGATVAKAGPSPITGFGVDIEYSGGLVYSTSGKVIDPATRTGVRSFPEAGLVEVTPSNHRVTFVSGTRAAVYDTRTGAPIGARVLGDLPPSSTDLVASATGFALSSPDGVFLVGALVGGDPVVLPPPPLSLASNFAVTEVGALARDILFDPARRLLYLSVPQNATASANEVIALDPSSGAIVRRVFVGSDPGPLALSDDQSRLFVGLNGIGSVAKIDVSSFSVLSSFSLGNSTSGAVVAEDIEVRPGTTGTLAVSLAAPGSPRHQGVAIFEAGRRLPESTPGHTGANRIEFQDGSTLYGTNNETTSFEFFGMEVDAAGVRRVTTTGHLLDRFGTDFDLTAGTVYATSGLVVDPARPALLGRLPTSGPIEAVVASRRIYSVSAADGSLMEYHLDTLRAVGSIALNAAARPLALVATGDGLAATFDNGTVLLLNPPLDQVVPTVSVGDVAVAEGDAGTRAAVFTLSLSEPAAGTVTVAYATTNASAANASDYTAKSGTASFAPGTTTVAIKVAVAGDAADEADESFNLGLSSPVGATLGDAAGLATIYDDDPATVAKRVAIGDVTVHEGDAGVRSATFTVSMAKAATSTVTVTYATANGTATKGTGGDYTAKSGTVSFAPGATAATVKVAINADTAAEVDETFTVTLSNSSGPTITKSVGTATIADDE